MAARLSFLQTSPQRLRLVVEDIHSGSEPRLGFYFLLVSSSLIASCGLVANSTAVIIGAMLVSPLMTPIFGVALGMLRGDASLFWQALTAEVMGVVLAVGFPFLFGLVPLSIEPTAEMLSRTSPNLLDLLVAVFAGFAGAYALVDERLSPALPGVAIATAIVPPLANTGLCLALGAETGAFGSFLLFGANFVTILLIGLVTFASVGLARDLDGTARKAILGRFVVPVIAFIATTVFLTETLRQSIGERALLRRVERELHQTFDVLAFASIEDVDVSRSSGPEGFDVLVTVRAPKVFHPTDVTRLQERLGEELGQKVQVVVRTLVAKDVAAVGSTARVSPTSLGGELFGSGPTEDSLVRMAEQVILENIGSQPGMRVLDVSLAQSDRGETIVVTLDGLRRPMPEEIEAARAALRERVNRPSIDLFVSNVPATLQSADTTFVVEWTDHSHMSPEDDLVAADLRRIVREEVRKIADLTCVGVHIHTTEGDGPWRLLAEVIGPRSPDPATVAALSESVDRRTTRAIELSAWFRSEVVVTSEGYDSFQEFTRPTFERRVRSLPELFR